MAQAVVSKPIYTSKTFWVNVVLFLLYLLAYPQLSRYVSPQVVGGVAALLNLVLRYVTSVPVTLT